MSTFLSALQNKTKEIHTTQQSDAAKTIDEKFKLAGIPISPASNLPTIEDSPLIVTVELVINRNRIDVWFNRKPSENILDSLRSHGFCYRPTDRAWYHKDSPENRHYCEVQFNAVFETALPPEYGAPTEFVTLSTQHVEKEETPKPKKDIGVTEETWEAHKRKVDALAQELNLAVTDLVIVAIDSLYEQTFSRDS